MPCWRR